MARKAVVSGGTRDEIIGVAKKLFLEKGFDGVTIRTIQREVGCEVGLFYYYFKSKDQVFDVVMEQLEAEWKAVFEQEAENVNDDPRAYIGMVFDCIYHRSASFGDETLHWSVRAALADRLAAVAANYIEEALKKTGVSLRISEKTLATVLAEGAGKLLTGCTEREYRGFSDELNRLIDAVTPEYRGRSKELSVELL